jgi:hypothetical protein
MLSAMKSDLSEELMGKLYKLDDSGHGTVAEWGEDEASQRLAQGEAEALIAKGCTLFDISEPTGKKIDGFDAGATEILAVPRMVGG